MSRVSDTFTCPCLKCGVTRHVVGGKEQPHECKVPAETDHLIAQAYWAGYDAGRAEGSTATGVEMLAEAEGDMS